MNTVSCTTIQLDSGERIPVPPIHRDLPDTWPIQDIEGYCQKVEERLKEHINIERFHVLDPVVHPYPFFIARGAVIRIVPPKFLRRAPYWQGDVVKHSCVELIVIADDELEVRWVCGIDEFALAKLPKVKVDVAQVKALLQ